MRYSQNKQQVSTLSQINNELEKVANSIDDMVSRKPDDGPNQLEVTLDANSQRIINLPAPQSNNEPLRQADIDLAEAQVQAYVDQGVADIDSAADSATSQITTSVANAEATLQGYRDAAQAAAVSAGQDAFNAGESATAAQSSELVLQGFIDEYASNNLVFPFDMGLVSDTMISNQFDLGGIA